jgi:ferredoxin
MSEPAVFDQNDGDGRVVVLAEYPAAEHLDGTRQAVRLCPARALALSAN